MDERPFISVIIAAGRKDLRPTLASIEQQDYPSSRFEVIVVTDLDELQLHPTLEIELVDARDTNPAYKRNLGAARASGTLLAFIDDDATAPPDWLSIGQSLMARSAEVAGCGGPNLLPRGADLKQRLSDALLTLPVLGTGNPSYGEEAVTRVAKAGDIHLVNMFIRRDVFERAGGFNESVGYGGEDTEFIYSVNRRLGLDFLYAGSLLVSHERRPFGSAYLRQRFMLRKNNGRLCIAFPGMYQRSVVFWAMALGPPGFVLTAVVSPVAATALACSYLVGVAGLAFWHRPKLAPLIIPMVPLHHATYVAGFYTGLLKALRSPGDIRRLRQRTPLFDEGTG